MRSLADVNVLSPRERQVLDLVAAGRTSKEIAAELQISVSTVNWHLANVFRKLGASSRAEAVAIALREGKVDLRRDAPATPWRRPSWHAAAAALALVFIGGAVVMTIDALPPLAPPIETERPAVSAVPSRPPHPTGGVLATAPPATSSAPPGVVAPAVVPPPTGTVPAATAPAATLAPAPLLEVPLPLPTLQVAPLPTPTLTTPTVTAPPLPTAPTVTAPTFPLPALPLPTPRIP